MYGASVFDRVCPIWRSAVSSQGERGSVAVALDGAGVSDTQRWADIR